MSQTESSRRTSYKTLFTRDRAKDVFVATVLQELRYLVSSYGFHVESIDFATWQTIVLYVNDTSTVKAELELGVFLPTIRVGKKSGRSGYRIGLDELPIDYIIEKRCPKLRLPFAAPTTLAEHDPKIIRSVVLHYAKALRKCAADPLTGDFRIVAAPFNQEEDGSW